MERLSPEPPLAANDMEPTSREWNINSKEH